MGTHSKATIARPWCQCPLQDVSGVALGAPGSMYPSSLARLQTPGLLPQETARPRQLWSCSLRSCWHSGSENSSESRPINNNGLGGV